MKMERLSDEQLISRETEMRVMSTVLLICTVLCALIVGSVYISSYGLHEWTSLTVVFALFSVLTGQKAQKYALLMELRKSNKGD